MRQRLADPRWMQKKIILLSGQQFQQVKKLHSQRWSAPTPTSLFVGDQDV
jgi:hypothetical protein